MRWTSGRGKSSASVFRFFLATIGFTWACWVPVVVPMFRVGAPAGTVLWMLGVFAPALVAIALTALEDGRIALRELLRRVLMCRVSTRWYLFAIAYISAIKLIGALIHRVTVGYWPQFGHEPLGVMLLATLVSTPVQSGEEIGWRGYALPRLAESMGFARASVVLGLVWAGWHLPQFFFIAADTYRQSFPIWAAQVTALSVAIAWLYVHTGGSLLLTMLMHAAINNFKDIVPSAVPDPKGVFSLHASRVSYLTTVLLWIAATYFLARIPKIERSTVK